jgi:putative membrane protein
MPALGSLPMLVVAQSDDWHHMDFDDGGWFLMAALMLAFWALVVVGIVWLVRELSGSRHPRSDDPQQILERRLASGEITVQEYEERREHLRG